MLDPPMISQNPCHSKDRPASVDNPVTTCQGARLHLQAVLIVSALKGCPPRARGLTRHTALL